MTDVEWAERRQAVFDAEAALEAYKRKLPDRPARGSVSKLSEKERKVQLARWAAENAECERLRSIYRAAVRRWLDPEPVEIHQSEPKRIMRAA